MERPEKILKEGAKMSGAKSKKKCKRCGIPKDVGEYGRHPHTKDKLQPNCRRCRSEQTKESWKSGKRGQGKSRRKKSKPVVAKMTPTDDLPWTYKEQMIYCNGQTIALATDERWAQKIVDARKESLKSHIAIAVFEQIKHLVNKETLKENAQLRDEVSKLKALASEKKEIPIIDGNGGGVHKREIKASKLRYIKSDELHRLMKRDGVTAKGLSKVLSIHQDCIYNWLNHKTRCKMGNIQGIAEYFEVDVSTLIDRNA